MSAELLSAAMTQMHLDRSALEAGVDDVRGSPSDTGVVELIVCRPAPAERELLNECELDLIEGLVGDNWRTRGSSSTPDGTANPLAQITLMNSRAAALIAGERERWPLAGDQLYVDFDISGANAPPGTRLALGSAVVEVTEKLHTGCKKFSARFGAEALRFVNTPVGRELKLRGINTKIVQAGTIRVGDPIRKL